MPLTADVCQLIFPAYFEAFESPPPVITATLVSQSVIIKYSEQLCRSGRCYSYLDPGVILIEKGSLLLNHRWNLSLGLQRVRIVMGSLLESDDLPSTNGFLPLANQLSQPHEATL